MKNSIQVVDEKNNSCGTLDASRINKSKIILIDGFTNKVKAVRIDSEILRKHKISLDEAKEMAIENGESEPLPCHFHGYNSEIYSEL